MEIITSHERTDMDALASIYGAALLFPDYMPVLPNKLNRNVRDFMALYRDALPLVERDELPRGHISRVVLVDTHAIAPMRGMTAQTELWIIDHHVDQQTPPNATRVEGDAVGATSTLLVERLREAGVVPDRVGSTLLLMGIYEDTGSLSYLTTTWRDAQGAAWLLENGADLEVANAFLRNPITEPQREVLKRLISTSHLHTIQGRSVLIAAIALDTYVDELSTLVHQLGDIFEPDGSFLLAAYRGDVQVIARSTTDAIDVAALLGGMGGGGHAKAAAALVQDVSLEEATARLRTALEEQVQPPTPVLAIMSTNVHTLHLSMSAREAARLMRRYGHEGFPVVEDERLIGILTRSDIDRALHHRLDDMTVRSLLHTGPLAVRPQDPVEEVERIMIEHNLGQVPVVEGGRFVGIVTRTDLIKLRARGQNHAAPRVRQAMEDALPERLRDLLITSRDVANRLDHSLYIVGGFVRDLLLGAPTLDLDLVVEGDAIALARALAERLGERVRSHARFGTAKVMLEANAHPDLPPSLDFVTARTEFYERPSELPQVERSSIKQDLYRRDFTINTMAVCLDGDRYGELLDFYGGLRDLNERKIRVLHNLSLIEDPTRILRAVRFEQRLAFAIEARTQELIEDALDLLDHVSGERLRNEVYLILAEREPERSLERLHGMGVLQHIHPSLGFGGDMPGLFARLRARLGSPGAPPPPAATASDESVSQAPPSLALCYLAVLTSRLSRADLATLTERLRITQHDTRFLNQVAALRDRLAELGAQAMLPSRLYQLLAPYSREARFVIAVLSINPRIEQRIELYERELAAIAPSVGGHDLRALGLPPGPVYGEILSRLRDALLDGQVSTPEQELELARALVQAAQRLAGT